MDSARVLEDSGSPRRRRPRRRHRRWIVAAAVAVVAAPLASGRANALNRGGTPAVKEGWTAYAPVARGDGKRPCRRGEKRSAMDAGKSRRGRGWEHLVDVRRHHPN